MKFLIAAMFVVALSASKNSIASAQGQPILQAAYGDSEPLWSTQFFFDQQNLKCGFNLLKAPKKHQGPRRFEFSNKQCEGVQRLVSKISGELKPSPKAPEPTITDTPQFVWIIAEKKYWFDHQAEFACEPQANGDCPMVQQPTNSAQKLLNTIAKELKLFQNR